MHTGLIKVIKIPPKTIHNWRVRGVLVDEIKATFYKIPERTRGVYFPWFLQNEHIVALAGQPLAEETLNDRGDAMVVCAWRFTGGSERDSAEEIRAAIARKPAEEQKCHCLYTLLLSECYPSPDLDLWIDFGFASCTSQEAEMWLSARYQKLITMCTFKEFCDAYRTRSLPFEGAASKRPCPPPGPPPRTNILPQIGVGSQTIHPTRRLYQGRV